MTGRKAADSKRPIIVAPARWPGCHCPCRSRLGRATARRSRSAQMRSTLFSTLDIRHPCGLEGFRPICSTSHSAGQRPVGFEVARCVRTRSEKFHKAPGPKGAPSLRSLHKARNLTEILWNGSARLIPQRAPFDVVAPQQSSALIPERCAPYRQISAAQTAQPGLRNSHISLIYDACRSAKSCVCGGDFRPTVMAAIDHVSATATPTASLVHHWRGGRPGERGKQALVCDAHQACQAVHPHWQADGQGQCQGRCQK